jgi:hypothetical protein
MYISQRLDGNGRDLGRARAAVAAGVAAGAARNHQDDHDRGHDHGGAPHPVELEHAAPAGGRCELALARKPLLAKTLLVGFAAGHRPSRVAKLCERLAQQASSAGVFTERSTEG